MAAVEGRAVVNGGVGCLGGAGAHERVAVVGRCTHGQPPASLSVDQWGRMRRAGGGAVHTLHCILPQPARHMEKNRRSVVQSWSVPHGRRAATSCSYLATAPSWPLQPDTLERHDQYCPWPPCITARHVLATTPQPCLASTADGVNEVATVRQLVGTSTARAWSAVLWEAHCWRVTRPTTASTPPSTTPQSTTFRPLAIAQGHQRGTPCPCCCSLRLSRTCLLLFLFPPGHAGPLTARSPASSPPRCPLPLTVLFRTGPHCQRAGPRAVPNGS